MVRKLFLTLFFLVFPVVSFGYYNPGVPVGFVNDYAGVLSSDQKVQLETKLSAFEKESSNEISVVTIKSLQGDTIENFAEKLFAEWGIGKTGRDNGVLLLVAIEDRKMRIEVGYGLEGVLTDAQSYSIVKNTLTPAFKQGDYLGGINGAVDNMISATKGEYAPVESTDITLSNLGLTWNDVLAFGFFILIWASSVLARSKSWWMGGVIGGVVGIIVTIIGGFFYLGLLSLSILIPLGLFIDFIVSRAYEKGKATGHYPWWIGGGPHGGGGFGGFGGGHSGGGGSSGSW